MQVVARFWCKIRDIFFADIPKCIKVRHFATSGLHQVFDLYTKTWQYARYSLDIHFRSIANPKLKTNVGLKMVWPLEAVSKMLDR